MIELEGMSTAQGNLLLPWSWIKLQRHLDKHGRVDLCSYPCSLNRRVMLRELEDVSLAVIVFGFCGC